MTYSQPGPTAELELWIQRLLEDTGSLVAAIGKRDRVGVEIFCRHVNYLLVTASKEAGDGTFHSRWTRLIS